MPAFPEGWRTTYRKVANELVVKETVVANRMLLLVLLLAFKFRTRIDDALGVVRKAHRSSTVLLRLKVLQRCPSLCVVESDQVVGCGHHQQGLSLMEV